MLRSNKAWKGTILMTFDLYSKDCSSLLTCYTKVSMHSTIISMYSRISYTRISTRAEFSFSIINSLS